MHRHHKLLAGLKDRAKWFAQAMDPSKPPVDVLESDSEIVLVADVPGAAREGLQLRAEGEELTLSAPVAGPPSGRALGVERSVSEWRRRFRLRGVDAEGARARLVDGRLTVRLPKRPGVARRRVDIPLATAAPGPEQDPPLNGPERG